MFGWMKQQLKESTCMKIEEWKRQILDLSAIKMSNS
jgi:hypothetical protein